MKASIIASLISMAIILALFIGEIKCIVKMCKCNWEPVGKAEVIYTIGVFTGTGCIIGYIDIEDK